MQNESPGTSNLKFGEIFLDFSQNATASTVTLRKLPAGSPENQTLGKGETSTLNHQFLGFKMYVFRGLGPKNGS